MTSREYNQCVDLYADSLYRFVLKNLRDAQASKDIVQDVFEKVWLKKSDIDFSKAKSYFFTAAYNHTVDYSRRRKDFLPADEKLQSSQSFTQYTDLSDVVSEALNRLPDVQKAVITLRDLEGYSYEEIGTITGLTESQVKVYIYRGRLALKNYLVHPEFVL